jgi:hypothetical protein
MITQDYLRGQLQRFKADAFFCVYYPASEWVILSPFHSRNGKLDEVCISTTSSGLIKILPARKPIRLCCDNKDETTKEFIRNVCHQIWERRTPWRAKALKKIIKFLS